MCEIQNCPTTIMGSDEHKGLEYADYILFGACRNEEKSL